MMSIVRFSGVSLYRIPLASQHRSREGIWLPDLKSLIQSELRRHPGDLNIQLQAYTLHEVRDYGPDGANKPVREQPQLMANLLIGGRYWRQAARNLMQVFQAQDVTWDNRVRVRLMA